jgi:hypothetical protein
MTRKGEWKTELLDKSMHMTHNLDVGQSKEAASSATTALVIAGKEGVALLRRNDAHWERKWLAVSENALRAGYTPPIPTDFPPRSYNGDFQGAGEVRAGRLPNSRFFVVTVEPMHGNSLVQYTRSAEDELLNASVLSPHQLTDKLAEGHALACNDILGLGSDQVIVGWRGKLGTNDRNIGVALWTPMDAKGKEWRETVIDADGMACEDLQLADLNGDGKLDIVASGRATKNLKIYLNETPPVQP